MHATSDAARLGARNLRAARTGARLRRDLAHRARSSKPGCDRAGGVTGGASLHRIARHRDRRGSTRGIDVAAGDTSPGSRPAACTCRGARHLGRAVVPALVPCRRRRARCSAARARRTRSPRASRGRLWLASYFPGEWSDPGGRPRARRRTSTPSCSGGMSVLLLKWRPRCRRPHACCGDRKAHAACAPARAGRGSSASTRRCRRRRTGTTSGISVPARSIGRARCADGRPTICCDTHGDVGILRQGRRAAARNPARGLRWSWRVDACRPTCREDTPALARLPEHRRRVRRRAGPHLLLERGAADRHRLSLPAADVEGQGDARRRRSGPAELGRWLEERRDLHADYRRIIGGPARSVVRIWLIANSLFQRGHGRCEYSAIELQGPDGHRLEVL